MPSSLRRTLAQLGRKRRQAIATTVVAALYAALIAVAIDASLEGDRQRVAAVEPRGATGAGVPRSTGADGATADVPAAATPSGGDASEDASADRGGVTAPGRDAQAPTREASTPIVMGRGITASEITIGIQVNEPIDYGGFGGGGRSFDAQRAAEAIVAAVNAEGGIAGREIVAIYHRTDVNDGSFEAQAQKACVHFTEDEEVFAATSVTSGTDNVACYVKHETPYVHNKRWVYERRDFESAGGYFYQPGRPSGERWVAVYVDGLAAQGFFPRDVKLGLLRYDDEVWRRLSQDVLKPRLAAHGVRLTEEVAIANPRGTAELSAAAASIGNAILRFRQAGVDHVLFGEAGGAMPFLFMPAAESQGYRPRYGFNSLNAIQFQEANVPDSQLSRSVGVGWVPTDDVNERMDPGGNPAAAHCEQILADAGLSIPSRTDQTGAMAICDALFFLRAALANATELTPAGLRGAVERFGTGYTSASTFTTRFGPGLYDGASGYRTLAFDDACGCFEYTSSVQLMP